MKKFLPSWSRITWGALCISLLGAGFSLVVSGEAPTEPLETEKLDARRAKSYLDKICRIGPRVSGSRGMKRQQNMIVEHFTRLGARVQYQSFDVAHPLTGRPVRMNNLIVSWNPQSKQRVLFACHYDTRPYPDRDLRNPRGIFLGANDGAIGVALFMELATYFYF